MKRFLVVAMGLLFSGVASGYDVHSVLLGPTDGPWVMVSVTYPTSTSEHHVHVHIFGNHGDDEIQLQSKAMEYVVKAKINGHTRGYVWPINVLSPQGTTITSASAEVDLEDGNNVFEYYPLDNNPDATHPACNVYVGGADNPGIIRTNRIITGNQPDSITVVGSYGTNIIVSNRGADTIISNRGSNYIFTNGGADWVYGGTGVDVVYRGPTADVVATNVETVINSGDDFFFTSPW